MEHERLEREYKRCAREELVEMLLNAQANQLADRKHL
jgi:hypothetical protein